MTLLENEVKANQTEILTAALRSQCEMIRGLIQTLENDQVSSDALKARLCDLDSNWKKVKKAA